MSYTYLYLPVYPHKPLPSPSPMVMALVLLHQPYTHASIVLFHASEMTYTVSGGALNSTQTKPNQSYRALCKPIPNMRIILFSKIIQCTALKQCQLYITVTKQYAE